MVAVRLLPVLISLLLLSLCRRKVKRLSNKTMFSYQIVACLGVMVFVCSCLLVQLVRLGNLLIYLGNYLELSPEDALRTGFGDLMGLPLGMTVTAFPFVFLFSGYLIVSSIALMKKEGRGRISSLGLFVGLALILGSLSCIAMYDLLDHIMDVHSYLGYHIDVAIENTIGAILWYLECLMVATIYAAKKSAKHIPKKPVDYVIVLGCRVLDDGMPGGMLRKRVDAALRLCRAQKDAFGTVPTLVLSGGKGADEPISETESMQRYALSRHFAGEMILEDESRTTRQNFLYSKKKMHDGKSAAFATTDFHVFRSGVLATKLGFKNIESVAAKSPWCYYANSLLREFVANLNIERKMHVFNLVAIIILGLALLAISYGFNIM